MKKRPKIPKKLAMEILLSTGKRCYHCGEKLNAEKRNTWHIDHHPVVFADIRDQICFGVTDPLERTNLVPSCVRCNVSHKYEISRWYYCNQSQFPCKRRFWKRALIFATLLASNVLSAYIAFKSCDA